MSRSRHPVRIYTKPPSPEVAARYLSVWPPHEILRNPSAFPPLTARGLFGRCDSLLELDIGCGTGDFCVELARRHPGRCLVGFDRAAKPLHRAVAAAQSRGLGNIRFVKTDFRVLLSLLSPASISAAYYHFPPPYVKARHERTGIFGAPFLNALRPALAPEGFCSVITDSPASFEHFVEVATASGLYIVNTDGPFRLELEESLKSFHHRKWESQSRPMSRLELYPR